MGESFSNLLRPDDEYQPGGQKNPDGKLWTSTVHSRWMSHMEVIPLTEDIGGHLPATFHTRLAAEAVNGWRRFKDEIGPSLPRQSQLKQFLSQTHAGALNDAFFHWQKRLFESSGNFEASLDDEYEFSTPAPDADSSWPEMNRLKEYVQLRDLVDRLSRRYLIRSGLDRDVAMNLNYSIFNWAAVHRSGEFHGPHTHVGEYHVGVFYAAAGQRAGKLKWSDPRGHQPPFGFSHFHTPRSGDLVMFPSWLSHMATVTAPATDYNNTEEEPPRVVFSFNIGPLQGPMPCHLWWSDPTGNMGFKRKQSVEDDFKAFGL